MPGIGPSLPPHLAHLASRSTTPPALPAVGSDSEDDADDFGPALPPHLAARRAAGPSRPSPSPDASSSRPPPNTSSSTRPIVTRPTYDDDDDDDVIGPVPIPEALAPQKSAVEEFREREERMRKAKEEESKPKKREREEWMLVPPTAGPLASVNPLAKRPTQFSRSTRDPSTVETSSIWTETPAEKAQRIADEVAGIQRPVKQQKVGEGKGAVDGSLGEEAERRRRDYEIRLGVEKHNRDSRGQSLLDSHAAKKAKQASSKDDPPAIWDHARDMGITGRLLNDQERQAKIRDARNLNDRFGHSKRGAYDM
ncbi:hypothetical protein BCR39DRAFT_481854 [Naematelia encephala]|uniref:DUF3752 domain-containing protein n=1 Tax=Naematelia encephala TaxID=71784 RepID=A0A1Y2B4U8_9TREE|nr:hypothetical protein BCR39DRAFT_481854 [Naematelia encephala]